MTVSMPNTQAAPLQVRQLFGGAITLPVPADYLDAR